MACNYDGAANNDNSNAVMDFIIDKASKLNDDDDRFEGALQWLQSHRCGLNKGSQESESFVAEQFLQWAQLHPDIKVVSTIVPPGILPRGCSGVLHDIKVFCRGPDDKIYDASEEIRQKIARGNCLLELVSDGQTSYRCVIYALKKFTGGLGDDDDRDEGDDFTWKLYFTKALNEAMSIVCTDKANGEAAHFSATCIQGQMYICAGSKNVHVIFRDAKDLQLYDPDQMRYAVAKEICFKLLEMLQLMSEETRQRLLQFLSVSRLTGIGEILNPHHPHVEDLSDLASPSIKFITWSSNVLEPSKDSLYCTMPPDVSLLIGAVFGLDGVKFSIIPVSELDDRMTAIRHAHGKEGEVLYFLDKDRNVIGLLKKKSVWYIVVRAIREKLRVLCSRFNKDKEAFNLALNLRKMELRMIEIQKWLNLSDDCRIQWQDIGQNFLIWSHQQLVDKQTTAEQLLLKFPVAWQKFLQDSGSTDAIAFEIRS